MISPFFPHICFVLYLQGVHKTGQHNTTLHQIIRAKREDDLAVCAAQRRPRGLTMRTSVMTTLKNMAMFGLILGVGFSSATAVAAPSTMIKWRFKQIDQNADGNLQQSEVLRLAKSKTDNAFTYLDENVSGTIELDEVLRGEQLLAMLHLAGNSEVRACMERASGVSAVEITNARVWFANNDASSNNSVEYNEWQEAVADMVSTKFSLMDGDDNEDVSFNEFKTYAASEQARRAALSECQSVKQAGWVNS